MNRLGEDHEPRLTATPVERSGGDPATTQNAPLPTLQLPATLLTPQQIADTVAQVGLLTAEEIEEFRASLPDAPIGSGQDLALELVRQNKLTVYQARAICEGRAAQLVLGNYTILDKIGEGGMGQVYRARHRRMKRVVALKVLPEKSVESRTSIERFRREVEAAARLEHPNVVTAYDADEAGGRHFLVMQYVAGCDLDRLVRKRGCLSAAQAVDCVLQAARGLAYAHREGVVHRDVKPSNLLVDANGTVKVLDLGLARLTSAGDVGASQTELTQEGAVMGTVDFMAPEQALDTRHADHRADIYSLGCTLHFMLTGRSVYRGATLAARLLAHQSVQIPSLLESRPDLPEHIDVLFRKMLAKLPEDRHQSMGEVVAELEGFAEQLEREADIAQRAAVETALPVADGASNVDPFSSLLTTTTGWPPVADDRATIGPHAGPNDTTPEIQKLADVALPRERSRAYRLGRGVSRLYRVVKARRVAAAILVLGLASVVYLAGIIIKVVTPDGTVVLEIDQAELAGALVSVDEEHVITLTTPLDKEPITFSVPSGKRTLKVVKGGFETFVEQFTVGSGEKKPIKVYLEPLTDVAVKDGSTKRLDSDEGDADVRAAQWVLEIGGSVGIEIDGQEREVKSLSQLPQAPYQLRSIALADNDKVSDDALGNLQGLQRIWSLGLSGTTITDQGLRRIQDLESLTYLDLDGTRITGNGLASLSRLSHLKFLELSSLKLGESGLKHIRPFKELLRLTLDATPITDNDVAQLRKLANLQVLSLDGEELTDAAIQHIVRLKELRTLQLAAARNIGAGRFKTLASLIQLESLNLHHSAVTDDDVKHFDSLKKLITLRILGTKVTLDGVNKLHAALPQCQIDSDHGAFGPSLSDTADRERRTAEWVLKMGGSVVIKFDGKEPEIKATQDLPREAFELILANLTGLRQVTDDDLKRFQGLKAIGEIILSGTQVTGEGFAQLDKLTTLYTLGLYDCPVTDSGVEEIKKLPWLTTLTLAGTGVTDEGLSHLKSLKLANLGLTGTNTGDRGLEHLKEMTSLTHLTLYGTGVTDAGLVHLQALTNLLDLDLRLTKITGNGLKHLAPLKNLRNLALDETQVTDADLTHLEGMTSLTGLGLIGTQVTDLGLSRLKSLEQLAVFHLGNTQVGDKGLAHLAHLKQLNTLHVENTQVTDAGLAHLGNLPALTEVRLAGTQVTDAGVAALRLALPNCNILWSSTDPHRRAADWVLSIGGSVEIVRDDVVRTVEKSAGLPSNQFELMSVSLAGNSQVSYEGLDLLNVAPTLKQLDLSHSAVFDHGLSRIAQLPAIESLDLTDTVVTDQGLSYLKGLNTLTELHLEYTQTTEAAVDALRADLPTCQIHWCSTDRDREAAEWVLSVGGDVALQRGTEGLGASAVDELPVEPFHLTNLNLTGKVTIVEEDLKCLQGLSRLHGIAMDNPIDDAGLKHFTGLAGLIHLNLADTRITGAGLVHLKDSTNLQIFTLIATQLDDDGMKPLAAFAKLKELQIGRTKITDRGLEHVKDLIELQTLSLTEARGFTGTGLIHLRNLKKLKKLFLSQTSQGDSGLEHLVDLTGLRELDLGLNITDAGLKHVSQLRELTVLGMPGAQISDPGMAHLKSLTNLTWLSLNGTSVTDVGIEQLESLENLSWLSLHGTAVTDLGLEHLKSLKHLMNLYLGSTRVGDKGLEHLSYLKELTTLHLDDTQVTDAGLAHLEKLPALTEVRLAGTQVTDAGVAALQSA